MNTAPGRHLFSRVPFTRLLGVEREFAQDGRARMVMSLTPQFTNMLHAAHGGVLMTLLDVVMASAAVSRVDFARAVVTLDMHSSFLRPGLGKLVAEGQVVGGGRSVCFCEAQVTDAEGECIARGSGTFKYIDLPRDL